MGRGRMPNRVGTDLFLLQQRHLRGYPLNVPLHHRVNPEPGNGPATTVQEHVFVLLTSCDERPKFRHGLRPERATAQLVAFSADLNEGMIPWCMRQRQIADLGLSRL